MPGGRGAEPSVKGVSRDCQRADNPMCKGTPSVARRTDDRQIARRAPAPLRAPLTYLYRASEADMHRFTDRIRHQQFKHARTPTSVRLWRFQYFPAAPQHHGYLMGALSPTPFLLDRAAPGVRRHTTRSCRVRARVRRSRTSPGSPPPPAENRATVVSRANVYLSPAAVVPPHRLLQRSATRKSFGVLPPAQSLDQDNSRPPDAGFSVAARIPFFPSDRPPIIRSGAPSRCAPRRPASSSDAAVLLIAVASSVGSDAGDKSASSVLPPFACRAVDECAAYSPFLLGPIQGRSHTPAASARSTAVATSGLAQILHWAAKTGESAKAGRRLATRRRGGIVRRARLGISGTPIGWGAAKISEGPASDRGGRGGRRKRDEEMTSHRVQPTGDKIRVAG